MESKSELTPGRILEARKAAGLSQGQLAKQIEVTKGYVSYMETGRRLPSRSLLAKIAQATKRPVAWFYGDAAATPVAGQLSTRERWLVLMFARIEQGIEIPSEERAMMNKLMQQAVLQSPVDLGAVSQQGVNNLEEHESKSEPSPVGVADAVTNPLEWLKQLTPPVELAHTMSRLPRAASL